MKKIQAFTMKLYPGMTEEYKKRHQEIWPDMVRMIHEYGGSNYSIFFDEATDTLFACIELTDEAKWKESSQTAICKKWWEFMADLMETNPDNSPVSSPLNLMFHLA
ncbi:L-rhamnose mutarotase [Caproicibacter sp. BJN0012]|uniref:L-rhamnose mutarotase n=1 Tax=Caproicibacter sp. BJN0012 TaxID=3110227 RepID=UPI002E0F429B